MAGVLLLRAPSGPEDRYEKNFLEAGYDPVSVTVLETFTSNLLELKALIAAGPSSSNLDGVIVTSARSCESWRAGVSELVSSNIADEGSDWKDTTFYVVGEATASALKEISTTYEETPFTPVIIKGQSSGTGEKLAQFILNQPPERQPKKLLYLTGDKNKDTIPSLLEKAGIELQSLKVYETRGSTTFEEDLSSKLSSVDIKSWWIVHFSPSAADFVTPILDRVMRPNQFETRIAAIGPVTATHLATVLSLRVDAVSSKPSPSDLLSSIRQWEKEHASTT